jgi:hypothetical protein
MCLLWESLKAASTAKFEQVQTHKRLTPHHHANLVPTLVPQGRPSFQFLTTLYTKETKRKTLKTD